MPTNAPTAYASKRFSADQEPVMRAEEAVNFDITAALSEGRRITTPGQCEVGFHLPD